MRRTRETRASFAGRGASDAASRFGAALSVVAALAVLAPGTLVPSPAHAGVATRTAFELSLLAGYADGTGWANGLPGSQRSAVGFEHLAKFSGDRGDVVTTNMQVRLSYDSQATDDAWAVEVHNAWLEYRLGLGRKLRFGHFAPAHGLESIRDTHGTLAQTLSGMDIGFKKDWGVAYSGLAGPVDLDLALQIGSGMSPAPDDGSFLASAQVWTPAGQGSRFGLSVARGNVRSGGQPRTLPVPDYAEGTTALTRVGAAVEHAAGAFTLLAEASAGRNDTSQVGGALLEVDYVPPFEQRLQLEWQLRAWDADLGRDGAGLIAGFAGASYQITDALNVRAALTAMARDGDIDPVRLTAQLYYYGGLR